MFTQSTVRTKLLAGFGLLALLMLVTAALSIVALAGANDRFAGYVNGINTRLSLSTLVRTGVDRRAIAARDLVIVTSQEDIAQEKSAVLKAHADVTSALAELNALMATAADITPAARAKVAELTRVESLYGPVALSIVDLALKGQQAAASEKIARECRPLLAQLAAASDEYAAYSSARAQTLVAAAEAEYSTQRMALMAATVASLAVALVAGLLITRSLVRALGAEPVDLSAAAQRIAEGDLGAIDGVAAARAGSVMHSLGAMQQSLAAIVSQVRGSSDSIANGSVEIASGNADLSRRTEMQAAALEETSATMTQLGATVRSNSDNAAQADLLARQASDVAVRGGDVVQQVVGTMKQINDSSRRIADILGVIDGIAFQTNILALNAAVEAARAGEQGRGFAVVAGEVRILAQRSAEAAKEIKTLIAVSVERVETGTELVDKAGATMTEVVASIQRVSSIVGEISAASVEQSTGVNQVGEAITQMDEVTQHNASLVEQSAAAAESLQRQASELVQAVAVFRLTEGADRVAA